MLDLYWGRADRCGSVPSELRYHGSFFIFSFAFFCILLHLLKVSAMAQVRDSFIDLERQRLLLEENVSKHQASLRHWQAWEIEYEGVKEELSSLGENHSQMDLEKFVQESEDNLFGNSERVSFNQKGLFFV